jgi:hypothetical protein
MNAFGVGAAVGLELRFDPINGRAVSVGIFAAVTELGQSLDGRLIVRQVEPSDQRFDWIVRRVALSPSEIREENTRDQQQSHFSIPHCKSCQHSAVSDQPNQVRSSRFRRKRHA